MDRHQLRGEMRHRRRSLSAQNQRQASRHLNRLLTRQPLFIRSQNIAFYIANDGEIDPRLTLRTALQMGKKCYLPTLQEGAESHLQFVRYTENSRLKTNRFGILEPIANTSDALAPQALDLVLLPLVAFDRKGGRLGMGGGFYDRSFAFKLNQPSTKPYLLGLAHHCQETEKLALEQWDILLHSVITDRNIVVCNDTSYHRDFCSGDYSK